MIRPVLLFLGAFALLNAAGGFVRRGFDQNVLWVDLRPLSPLIARVAILVAAALLVAHGIRPAAAGWRRWASTAALAVLTGVALFNAVRFYVALARGAIRVPLPVPLSLLFAALLAFALVAVLRRPALSTPPAWAWPAVGACLALAFPLAQMTFFGRTDYRRPADAIVVFGARAYADGRASTILADRVRTGCALYHEGLAERLLLSGGPGDGAVHETEAMRHLAESLGVPAGAILTDRVGLNTRATAANTAGLIPADGRVLVVSHAFHLPRIRMAYDRAGVRAYGVPARQTKRVASMPISVAREVVAFWWYWLRG